MNKTGEHCQDFIYGICEHQMIDSPMKQDICTGRGGECINGNRFTVVPEKNYKKGGRVLNKEERTLLPHINYGGGFNGK